LNDDAATSPRPAPGAGLLAWYAVAGGLLLANLAAFVRQNAVDLPFSDQLGLHELVWNHASLWTLFDFQ
jgi:hypothetical protein